MKFYLPPSLPCDIAKILRHPLYNIDITCAEEVDPGAEKVDLGKEEDLRKHWEYAAKMNMCLITDKVQDARKYIEKDCLKELSMGLILIDSDEWKQVTAHEAYAMALASLIKGNPTRLVPNDYCWLNPPRSL